MSSNPMLEALADFAAKYAVVQAAVAAGVFLYIWQKVIRRGEADPPSNDELRARWKAQENMSDISENVKTVVVHLREIRDSINRLTSEVVNRQQE